MLKFGPDDIIDGEMELIELLDEGTELDEGTLSEMRRAEELIGAIKGSSGRERFKMADELYGIGLKFDAGDGVVQSDEVAFVCFYGAAVAGHAESQYRVGLAYDTGYGVEEDLKEARRWYGLAAAQSHPIALRWLGYSYVSDDPVHGDAELAVRYLSRAEQLSDPQGTYYLGLCYLEGFGVPKSREKALQYIMRASDLDCQEAREHIARMQEEAGPEKSEIE